MIVNSSDGFEDCWEPFFTLLKKNWPDFDYSLILNTEFKNYSFDGLKIVSSKVHEGILDRKLSWSECLIKAIELVDTPLILYVQEDYFIEKPVLKDTIDEFSRLMEGGVIKYIGLTDIGNFGPFKNYEHDKRLVVVGNSKYRISTQAALWDKDTLLSYLRPAENGWMFEIFGTQRAKRRSDLFLTANRLMYSSKNNPIITYMHTGIIKGQWHENIPELFKKENISIDVSLRGIYKPKAFLRRKFETGRKLLNNPLRFIIGMLGK
ncbi:hypothetical protein ADIARSV_2844 [Arcticibacter svalbardensis MN12-7]|uniref:Glycosyltransferase n=2 Tax=Arcticibacter TaxID=1288026 RepID=R9GR30_9SPHI|nr:hypothetical protein ADIARSV_2844 [Arcticibacter svalbardensis MN12-7]